MINAIIWTLVGLFIGWNLPQPQIAKDIQDKIVSIF